MTLLKLRDQKSKICDLQLPPKKLVIIKKQQDKSCEDHNAHVKSKLL
jgi:hypothetical protein